MVLRHQCRRLVVLNRLYSLSCCHSIKRPLHTTPSRSKDIDNIVEDEGIIEAPENRNDDEPRTDALGKIRKKVASQRNFQGDETSEPKGKSLTFAEIDRTMSPEDLGLKKVKRTQKRRFIQWLIKSGQAHEHFPQTLVQDIEERRVENIRKRAEGRMFARMNAFFNSLTLEEIQEGQLQEPVTKGQNGQERVALQEPTPFKNLMTKAKDPRMVESKVLAMLKTYDPDTHRMYRNYIDWCDFKLQKQTVWFDFQDATPEEHGDLITRLLKIEQQADNPQPVQLDLANHVGRSFGDQLVHFQPAVIRHYLGDLLTTNFPFSINQTFKPWRPLSHTTRQQMFDAWREGLGLRNIAWLGGVSWRRVDGIIGILKREWDFVRQGGKLEHHMAEYMEGLLASTPIENLIPDEILTRPRDFLRRPLPRWKVPSKDEGIMQEQPESYDDLLASDIPLADPPIRELSGRIMTEPLAPNTQADIFVKPQVKYIKMGMMVREQNQFVTSLNKEHKRIREWEASQKEPLVEIPIKRTKQYFAIIQEMEEYDEKRAAKALDGTDGRTMSEKEEGIKMFQRFFGGLRSLEGREKYQGTPPWEQETSEVIRRALTKQAEKKDEKPTEQHMSTSHLTPADSFRLANATEPAALTSTVVESPKERVVWRFEDVSWVKQRTTRSRKKSYVGRLDFRVQTESGVARYGPFGIGGGVEGVGGIKQVLERGRDGRVRVGQGEREKRRVRREIVV